MSDVLKLDYELIREMGIKFQGLGNEGVNQAVDKLFDDIDGKNFSPSGFLNLAEMSAQLKVDTAFLVVKLEGLGGNLINAAEAIRTQDRYLAEKFMKEAYRMDAIEYTSTQDHWIKEALGVYSMVMLVPDTYEAGQDLADMTKMKWISNLMNKIDSIDPAIPYAAAKWQSLKKIKVVGGAMGALSVFGGGADVVEGISDARNELGSAFNDFENTGDTAKLNGEIVESAFDDGIKIVGGTAGVISGLAILGGALGLIITAPAWLPAVGLVATAAGLYALADMGVKHFWGKSIGEHIGGWIEDGYDRNEAINKKMNEGSMKLNIIA